MKDFSTVIVASALVAIEPIGRCAQGEIWKGIWKQTKRHAITVRIIKVAALGLTENQRTKLINDINNLSKVYHNNTLKFYGACKVEREVWIISEYTEGTSLFELLHSNKPILEIDWLRVAHQATLAVHSLHSGSSTILHRDIKSKNFLLSKDLSTLKLIDFGLTRIVTVVSDVQRELESPRWGAPETLDYPPKWTTAADIYSLGLVFYEIVTRKIPFQEHDDEMSFKASVQSSARPDLPDDCPEEFAEIIRQCWDPEPDKRPTSDQLLQMLENLLPKDEIVERNIQEVATTGENSKRAGKPCAKESLRQKRKSIIRTQSVKTLSTSVEKISLWFSLFPSPSCSFNVMNIVCSRA